MISPERIEQVTRVVEKAGLNERTLSALREAFAEIHFTYCREDDIGTGVGIGNPVREASGFNLCLVDGRSHCMRFTTNPEVATGLVLAETDDGD
jgi:hypothetical protein